MAFSASGIVLTLFVVGVFFRYENYKCDLCAHFWFSMMEDEFILNDFISSTSTPFSNFLIFFCVTHKPTLPLSRRPLGVVNKTHLDRVMITCWTIHHLFPLIRIYSTETAIHHTTPPPLLASTYTFGHTQHIGTTRRRSFELPGGNWATSCWPEY